MKTIYVVQKNVGGWVDYSEHTDRTDAVVAWQKWRDHRNNGTGPTYHWRVVVRHQQVIFSTED